MCLVSPSLVTGLHFGASCSTSDMQFPRKERKRILFCSSRPFSRTWVGSDYFIGQPPGMCSAICIPAVPDVHRNKAKSNSFTGRQGLGWQLEGQGALDEHVAGETQVSVCDCGGDAVKSQQASRMSNHSFVGNLPTTG